MAQASHDLMKISAFAWKYYSYYLKPTDRCQWLQLRVGCFWTLSPASDVCAVQEISFLRYPRQWFWEALNKMSKTKHILILDTRNIYMKCGVSALNSWLLLSSFSPQTLQSAWGWWGRSPALPYLEGWCSWPIPWGFRKGFHLVSDLIFIKNVEVQFVKRKEI